MGSNAAPVGAKTRWTSLLRCADRLITRRFKAQGSRFISRNYEPWLARPPCRLRPLSTPFAKEDGSTGIRWETRDLEPPLAQQAADAFRSGLSVREVAAVLGISRSEAGRQRQKAIAEGLFTPSEEEPEDEPAPNHEGSQSVN